MNFDMDKVPASVAESLQMFLLSLSEYEKKALNDVDEDQIAFFLPTFGEEIKYNWSLLEKNTPLTNNFKSLGITHPDDMCGIILTSAHRQLHKKSLKVSEQVKKYQEYWKKEIGKPMP